MFRSEVLSRRSERLSGDVAIFLPVAWQGIGYVLLGSLALALAYLALASYSRSVSVAGRIAPAAGVAAVMPTRPGTISRILVREGQTVKRGDALAVIRVEEDASEGSSPASRVAEAIDHKDRSLAAQADASLAAAQAQVAQLVSQRTGLVAEIAQLREQALLQRDLVASARTELERARPIAARGFVSARDMQAREDAVVSRRMGLAQLEQQIAAKSAQLSQAAQTASQVEAQARAQDASLAASRADVAQQAADAAGARDYALRAPIDGRVTALTARVGQPAVAAAQVMSIVPVASRLTAQLEVSSAAIGFVRAGQQVRLSVDAFPYQRFGTLEGRITTVAGDSVDSRTADGRTVAVYPVTVSLPHETMPAYGRPMPLVPGMTLNARIVTDRQSLLQWLFDPLYAVARR